MPRALEHRTGYDGRVSRSHDPHPADRSIADVVARTVGGVKDVRVDGSRSAGPQV